MMQPDQAAPVVETLGGDPSPTTGHPPIDQPTVAPAARSRLGSTLIASTIGMLLALGMVVFALQNDTRQAYEFLWVDFTLPDGIAILLATICGGLIVALLGLARVLQLRLAARRHRRLDHQAA